MQELAELDAQRARLIGHRGRAILEDAHSLLEKAGVADVATRLRHGDIVEAVADVEGDARVILIGKRGEAADFARGHLGSNLERIVRASHKPVFVASRGFRPIHKVLVAYDGGASVMRAVDHIARSPLFKGLAIHVVTVGSATPEVTKDLGADMQKIVRYVFGPSEITRPISAPPGIPEDRVAALRKALLDTMKDPEVVATGAKLNIEWKPMTGEELKQAIVDLYDTPPEIIKRSTELTTALQ